MVVMGDDSDIMEYGWWTPELSKALLHMKEDAHSIEKKTF